MATEVIPVPNLGEILQELSKNSRPGITNNKICSIPTSTIPDPEPEVDTALTNTKKNSKSSKALRPPPGLGLGSKDSGMSDPPVAESPGNECTMYEGTHFTQAEGERLMKSLTATILEDHDTPEIDMTMFQMIVKHLNVSHFFMIHKVFNVLDSDQDAKISRQELIEGLSILFRGSFEEHIQFAFKVYDSKHQGFLSRKDVATCVGDSLRPKSINCWKGTQTTMPHENTQALAELIFPKLDIDKDGKISFNDFRSACVNDPTLIESLGSWLPNESPCHNAHRVSQETVSNLSNQLNYLTRTSFMARLCTPDKSWMKRRPLKLLQLKLEE